MNSKVIKTADSLVPWTSNGLHDDTSVAPIKITGMLEVLQKFKDYSTIILEYKMFKTSELPSDKNSSLACTMDYKKTT